MSGWRLAARLARRDARRHRGRTALVVALAALPAFGLTALAGALRAHGELSPTLVAERELGRAGAKVVGHQADAVAAARYAMPGARVVGGRIARRIVALPGGRFAGGSVTDLPLADPLLTGSYRVVEGRLPERAGEIFVEREQARETGLRIGDAVTVVEGGRPLRVVGVGNLADATFLVAPGEPLGPATDTVAYVETPRGTSFPRELPHSQVSTTSREDLLFPSRRPDPAEIGAGVFAAGMAIFEAALLAGSAFAAGTRRRGREFGLLAATGATRGQLARIVLVHGGLLGLVAGGVGVATGLATAAAALRGLEGAGLVDWPAGVRPYALDVALALLVGLLTGLAAALVTALATARRPVVEALTGRRAAVTTRRRGAAAGLAAIATGGLCMAAATVSDLASGEGRGLLVLAGTVLAGLGMAGCAGAVLRAVARGAGRLPLPLRLAARDAAGPRSPSVPAIAAIMAGLTGTVAVSLYVASDAAWQRETHVPALPRAGLLVSGTDPKLAERVASVVPARQVFPLRTTGYFPGRGGGRHSALATISSPDRESMWAVGVADPAMLREIGVSEQAVDAVARGGAVVLDPDVGRLAIVVTEAGGRTEHPLRAVYGGVHLAGTTSMPSVYVSDATARALRLPLAPSGWYVATERPPTADEVSQARALAHASDGYLSVESVFDAQLDLAVLALLAVGAAVTVTATAVAVTLLAVESRPDLATLAAIGATPALRRLLAGGRALVVAGLGSLLGAAAGAVPTAVVVAARPDRDLVVPWGPFALALVGVPVAAALFAALVTRSRLPLDRRLA